jgi:hypothetical protein
MLERWGVLVVCLFTALPVPRALAQRIPPAASWPPPQPCTGDSAVTHARPGNSIRVPDLDAVPLRRAKAMLAKLRLGIEMRRVRMRGTSGVVIAQSPQAGVLAASDDVVIVCSRFPSVIPAVVGLAFDNAQRLLAESGYDAIRSNSFVDRASLVGKVVRQQPPAGREAQMGSVDTLIVGVSSPISIAVPPRARPLWADTATAAPPTPSVFIFDDETTDLTWLWKSIVGAGILLVAFAALTTAVRAKDRRRLAALRVVPRQHPGRPHLVRAMHEGERTGAAASRTEHSPTLRAIFNVSEDAAKTRILTAVDAKVWDGVRIPPRLREDAAGKIAATLDAFLSTSVLGLVSSALESHRELAKYADGKDHEVDKIDLSIESEHEPHVELKTSGRPPQSVRFSLVVSIEFSGATLVISRNRVKAMKTGRCIVSGTLQCEKLELFRRPSSPFKLRNEIQFGEGIPIHRSPN